MSVTILEKDGKPATALTIFNFVKQYIQAHGSAYSRFQCMIEFLHGPWINVALKDTMEVICHAFTGTDGCVFVDAYLVDRATDPKANNKISLMTIKSAEDDLVAYSEMGAIAGEVLYALELYLASCGLKTGTPQVSEKYI